LSTGKFLLEGWQDISKWVNYIFVAYLIVWSFIVGGSLLTHIGIVTSSMLSVMSPIQWSIVNALLALFVVRIGYKWFERIMEVLIVIMVVSVIAAVIIVKPDFLAIAKGAFSLSMPAGSTFYILAMIGGVGATVTIMCYGYWIREKGMKRQSDLKQMRFDLSLGYIFTAIFCMCILILASNLYYGTGHVIEGRQGVIGLGNLIGQTAGDYGYWIFMFGFWATIFSTLMSFYQAIPYLFSNWVNVVHPTEKVKDYKKTRPYFWYQMYCVFIPMLLLFSQKPILLTLIYSVMGALFMPFIIITLLILGSKIRLKNSKLYVGVSILILALYVYLGIKDLIGL
jgi:Mn2+/Fe2+ NRAMP family transporter